MVYPTPLKLGTDTNLRSVKRVAGCWKLKCAGFIRTGRVAGTLSPLFPAEMVPETIAILGSPRLNPTHFAFRPLRATERSGSGRPRSTGDRCTRGDPGRRQTKQSGRAERIGSGCLRQRAPNIARSTLQPRATPKPNETTSKTKRPQFGACPLSEVASRK